MRGWAAVWVIQLLLVVASCAPSIDEGASRKQIPGEIQNGGFPEEEKEVIGDILKGPNLDRDLMRKHREAFGIKEKEEEEEEEEEEVEELSSRNLDLENELDERYIGFCKDAYVRMWPGNSRKFWSFGYVYLKEPYLANCTMRYFYNTRNYAKDPFCKFGFLVEGSFEGHTDDYVHCTDTDYVLLKDSHGNEAFYCGTFSEINWITPDDHFEFYFITKEDSPRAKGFFVWIRSFKLCGGSYTIEDNGPSGNILSPRYPMPYLSDVACNWYFQVPSDEGHEISVKITCSAFDLQEPFNNGTDFCLDAVTFTYEAPFTTETQVYCSDSLHGMKHIVYSTHNSFIFTFRTDSDINHTGFNCTYEFILFGE